jgi:hypothetical protein
MVRPRAAPPSTHGGEKSLEDNNCPGELYPGVGFIVTNMARSAENVVAFYNKRGTCEQWIKEGKSAIRWTRLSCRSFAANAVRLQLHALAPNLGKPPANPGDAGPDQDPMGRWIATGALAE